jgi:hypothetical protein
MKWNEMLTELNRQKIELVDKVVNEMGLDSESVELLKLISEISSGGEFVGPEELKPYLEKVGIKLFDPSLTKAIQNLYEKGFVKLGIALNTNQN